MKLFLGNLISLFTFKEFFEGFHILSKEEENFRALYVQTSVNFTVPVDLNSP